MIRHPSSFSNNNFWLTHPCPSSDLQIRMVAGFTEVIESEETLVAEA
jgi:hypothetical protein